MAGLGVSGDVLALVEISLKLSAFIDDFRNAPVQYQASVQSLHSLHAAFICMTNALERYHTPGSSTVDVRDYNPLFCLLHEIELAKSSLKEAMDLLTRQYVRYANSRSALRWIPRFRWTFTKSRFETSVRYANQHLQRVHFLVGTKQLYDFAVVVQEEG